MSIGIILEKMECFIWLIVVAVVVVIVVVVAAVPCLRVVLAFVCDVKGDTVSVMQATLYTRPSYRSRLENGSACSVVCG